jgi:hypothetical protein
MTPVSLEMADRGWLSAWTTDLARLRAHGAELIGEVAQYEDKYLRPSNRSHGGFKIKGAGKIVSARQTADRSRYGKRSFRSSFDDAAELTSVPSRYSSSSRHDSSLLPSIQRTNASEASGDSKSPRSAASIAAVISASSSG